MDVLCWYDTLLLRHPNLHIPTSYFHYLHTISLYICYLRIKSQRGTERKYGNCWCPKHLPSSMAWFWRQWGLGPQNLWTQPSLDLRRSTQAEGPLQVEEVRYWSPRQCLWGKSYIYLVLFSLWKPQLDRSCWCSYRIDCGIVRSKVALITVIDFHCISLFARFFTCIGPALGGGGRGVVGGSKIYVYILYHVLQMQWMMILKWTLMTERVNPQL